MKLHHANIIADTPTSKDFVFKILSEHLNFHVERNPDFLLQQLTTFGIDEVRRLESWALTKPFLGEVKASAVFAESVTHEAQNALLKLLEEPPLGTYIFIILKNTSNLLPTLLSRVNILETGEATTIGSKMAQKFLSSTAPERLKIARSLLKDDDKSEIKNFINDLEVESYKKRTGNLKVISDANMFGRIRGSSPKIIIEWLCSVL